MKFRFKLILDCFERVPVSLSQILVSNIKSEIIGIQSWTNTLMKDWQGEKKEGN